MNTSSRYPSGPAIDQRDGLHAGPESPAQPQHHRSEHDDAVHAQRRMAEFEVAVEVDIRLQVLDRLRLMSVHHADNAWRGRNGDPLAPHCLAFLFVHRDPMRVGMWLVSAAWRIWEDKPEVRSLPHLLNTLNKSWAYGACGDGSDIRAELADRCDPQPTDTPVFYAGLGVISLDTPTGTWEQARRAAQRASDIPAEIRVVLTDKTTIVAQRLGSSGFDEFRVECSHRLEYGHHRPHYPYQRVDAAQLHTDSRHSEVLRWASELSDTLSQADTHWLDAQKRAAQQIPGHRP